MMLRSPGQDTGKAWTFCTQCFSVNPRRRKCTWGTWHRPRDGTGAEPGKWACLYRGVSGARANRRQWAGLALAGERCSARGVNSSLRRGGAGEWRAGAGCVRPRTSPRSPVASSMESPDAARPFVRTPLTAASVVPSGHPSLSSRLRPLRRSRPLRPAEGRGESAGKAAVRPALSWGLEGA